MGMMEGRIPWTAMKDWCEEHQIYGLQRENVLFHVKSMDLTYLKFMAEKAKRK